MLATPRPGWSGRASARLQRQARVFDSVVKDAPHRGRHRLEIIVPPATWACPASSRLMPGDQGHRACGRCDILCRLGCPRPQASPSPAEPAC
jgi:hypothetical protein